MSLSPAVRREYLRIRSTNPFMGARNALLWARSIVTPNLPEGVEETDDSRGRGNQTVLAKGTTDGFEVEIYVEPDYYSEPRGTWTDTWSPEAVQRPDWRPGDRDRWRYFVPEHGETQRSMAQGWSRSGMSRGNAWILAGEALRDDVRRAGDEREVYMVAARVSRAGVLLAEDALHGCDVDSRERWSVSRSYLLDTGIEVLSEALHGARERLADLVASAAS